MADVVGAAELGRRISAMVDAIGVAVGRALDQSADSARDDMRRDVPVDTGHLRDHITVEKPDEFTREVGPRDVLYAQWVELGTSSMPARPFVVPAGERERLKLSDRVTTEINREIA